MNLTDAAIGFAAAGTPVLPLHSPVGEDGEFICSCGRKDCPSPAKHPRTLHGVDDATTDEAKIRGWWQMWPDANIGLALGHGYIVVDVDGPDAETQLDELQREHGSLPATMTVHTGRDGGGRHLYFRATPGVAPQDLGHGLEVRGAGRYVVSAHSRHITGRVYTPIGEKVSDAPSWLLDAPERRNGHAPAVNEEIITGERNNTLASLAGTMRRRGMSAPEIEAALMVANRSRCRPPLKDAEVRQIAASVARYKPAEYKLSSDPKTGKAILPDLPADDVAEQCRWLTATLARDPEHPIIEGEWQGLRGPDGHVVLRRAGAPPIRFEPAKHINTPMRLLEILAWQRIASDPPPPKVNGDDCRKIAHVIGSLCDSSRGVNEKDEAEGVVGGFLQAAVAIEGHTTYGTSGQRYEAARALQRDLDDSSGRPLGAPRYLIDEETGELVIRVSDLSEAARRYTGASLPRGWLDGRIANLGWVKVRLDGHLIAGREGREGGPHLRCDVYRGHLSSSTSDEESCGHEAEVTT